MASAHQKNLVKALSDEQIRAIYTGKTTNRKQRGGSEQQSHAIPYRLIGDVE